MSKSYTPGLKILRNTKISKERLLPLRGDVHVSKDLIVNSDTIVASTEIPGNVQMINIANKLNIDAEQILDCVVVKVGDSIIKDQLIAESKGLFGMFKSEVRSPIDGKIINASKVTGQIVIAEKPLPINVDADIPGTIKDVFPKEGVIIDSIGTFVQGIIGIGGEKKGTLEILTDSPSSMINMEMINNDYKDKIIVCGSSINYDFYEKAKKIGVKGIVCGGINYNSVSKILGYSLGVAITGTEKTTTLILTEGFGEINMAQRTFDILLQNNGKKVSINGATQIRAGVLRPEIFIESKKIYENDNFKEDDLIISEGSTIRIIREPYFGQIGQIISLPYELVKMKSETMVRVAEIKFENGNIEIIPRANLEVILSN